MSDDASTEDLLSFGVRVQSARDVSQLRWLLAHADALVVRMTAARMTTRLAPRPQQVIAELGLERRRRPREGLAPAPVHARMGANARQRERGWYSR